MRQTSMIVTFLVYVLTASIAQSQNPPAQQPGAAPAPTGGQSPAPPTSPSPAAAAPSSNSVEQQVSYALGRQFAMNLQHNEIPCNLEWLFAGIRDTISGAQPKFSDEQLGATMQQFSQEMQQKRRAKVDALVAKNQKLETDFLAKNGTRQGVQTTGSGLQYKVLQAGTGPSPTLSDTVRCNYRGVLLTGAEFDKSQNHGGPVEFPVEGVIPGWTEALQKMKVGDKWELYVPAALAYDKDPPPDSPIEPGSTLIFEIELLEIKGQ